MEPNSLRDRPNHTILFPTLILLGFLHAISLQARVDPEFNSVLGGEDGEVFAMVRQMNGDYLIAGNFTSFKGVVRYGLVRIHPSGDPDLSFDAGLVLPATAGALSIQPDGRVVVGGGFQSVNGTTRYSLMRLNADGSLDASFNPPPLLNRSGKPSPVNVALVLSDGRIVAGGSFETVGGTSHRRVARFNANGSLDATFNADINGTTVSSLALQPDGRILVGGAFSQVNGTNCQNLARLNPDGSLDSSFDSRQFAHGECTSILVESNSNIVITTGGSCRRLSSDGRSLDPDFVEPEFGLNARAYRVVKTPDGGYAVGGEFYSSGNRFSLAAITLVTNTWVAVGDATYAYPDNYPTRADLVNFVQQRIHKDQPLRGVAFGNGTLLAVNGSTNVGTTSDLLSWDYRPVAVHGGLNAIAFGEDRFVAAGYSNALAVSTDQGRNWSPVQISGLPVADYFGVGTGAGQWVVVGGTPTSGTVISSTRGSPWTGDLIGTNRLRAATFGADTWVVVGDRGSIFTSPDARVWTVSSNSFSEDLYSVAFGNGNFIAVGDAGRILYSPNGKTWKSVYNYSTQLPLQPLLGVTFGNGKFMVVGRNGTVFATDPSLAPPSFYFVPRYLLDRQTISLVRLDPGGVVRTNFDSGILDLISNYKEAVRCIIPEDSGLVVAGQFVQVAALDEGALRRPVDSGDVARLGSGGLLDRTMAVGMGAAGESPPNALVFQPDGKLLLGGDFTSVNGISRNRIARVNANGSLDATFDPGAGADRLVACIALSPRNQILIGGRFNSVNGLGSRPVARLNSDGTPDPSFVLPPNGAAFNDTITAMAVDDSGRVLINGSTRRVMRLQATGEQDLSFQIGNGAKGGSVSSIAMQPDGKILLAGSFTNFNNVTTWGLVRVLPSGETDATFMKNLGTGPNQSVSAVLVRTGAVNSLASEILLAGSFTRINDVGCNHLARLSVDGVVDPAFGNRIDVATNLTMIVAANGEGMTIPVYVSGPFTNFAGIRRSYAASVNLDGSFNPAFNGGTGPDGPVYSMAAAKNRSVILGGAFKSVDGLRWLSLVRMQEDATIEPEPGLLEKWAKAHFTAAELDDPNVTGELSDPDGDGIPNLWEYALNLDPKKADRAVLPAPAIQENSSDHKSYFIFGYRRRIGESGLNYRLEVSDDLTGWDSSAARFEELSVSPDADAVLETVVVRIRPAIQDMPRGYVRCRINRKAN